MTRMVKSFLGRLDQLDVVVRASGATGKWQQMDGYVRFKRTDGAILNWWKSTGTFNFQGPPAAAKDFEQALAETVSQCRRSRLALICRSGD